MHEYDEDDLNRSFESRLREELMKGYSPDLRPVQNTSTITFVNLTLINIQIIKVVSDLININNYISIVSILLILISQGWAESNNACKCTNKSSNY